MRTKAALLSIATTVLVAAAACPRAEATRDPAKLDDEGTIEIFKPPRTLEPEVTFLSEAPKIDGTLDDHLEGLPVREFSRLWKSKPDNPVPAVHYRLAYGTDFFYVYIEAEAESLAYRDRAYQNGDGFSLVIAKPRPDDEPTDEFYVLSCSAVNKPDLEWSRCVFWYYNVYDIFLPTSDRAKLELREGGGRISFELLLPWSDVHPYHPWISDAIGFNLRFVKAIGERDLDRYQVIPGTIGGENSPRWYGYLKFQKPTDLNEPQTFVSTDRRNAEEGTPVHGIAVTAGPEGASEAVAASVKAKQGDASWDTRCEYKCGPGVTSHEFEAVPADLPDGDYTLNWESRRNSGEMDITILPRFDSGTFAERMRSVKDDISPGSFTTLQYKVQFLESLLAGLHPYETASYERAGLVLVEDQLGKAEHGIDPYAAVTGPLRRAFRSKLDGTLQPYVVIVPEGYDPARQYPLLVVLHGSASTESDIAGHDFIYTAEVIAIGPYGRGRSNGFATAEAQTDIAEAIDDAISNYSIDTKKIVLTGFSMGGYGVYRTQWETPHKFRALAVFSGGTRFGGEDPNFLTQDLDRFNAVPMFISHGEQDRNVSCDEAFKIAQRLRAAGALVEFHSDPDRGHDRPSDATIKAYQEWLASIVER
jgi:predicted esterase